MTEGRELILVNEALANKLWKAGVELTSSDRIIDGNQCFVFLVTPDKEAITKKIMNG